MYPISILIYRCEIWHGYTMEYMLCSHIASLGVFDTMLEPLNIGDINIFNFKMYISAVFGLIAMNASPYSLTVTWYMCAEFAAFTSWVWVFCQVVAIAFSPNGLTVWVAI